MEDDQGGNVVLIVANTEKEIKVEVVDLSSDIGDDLVTVAAKRYLKVRSGGQ